MSGGHRAPPIPPRALQQPLTQSAEKHPSLPSSSSSPSLAAPPQVPAKPDGNIRRFDNHGKRLPALPPDASSPLPPSAPSSSPPGSTNSSSSSLPYQPALRGAASAPDLSKARNSQRVAPVLAEADADFDLTPKAPAPFKADAVTAKNVERRNRVKLQGDSIVDARLLQDAPQDQEDWEAREDFESVAEAHFAACEETAVSLRAALKKFVERIRRRNADGLKFAAANQPLEKHMYAMANAEYEVSQNSVYAEAMARFSDVQNVLGQQTSELHKYQEKVAVDVQRLIDNELTKDLKNVKAKLTAARGSYDKQVGRVTALRAKKETKPSALLLAEKDLIVARTKYHETLYDAVDYSESIVVLRESDLVLCLLDYVEHEQQGVFHTHAVSEHYNPYYSSVSGWAKKHAESYEKGAKERDEEAERQMSIEVANRGDALIRLFQGSKVLNQYVAEIAPEISFGSMTCHSEHYAKFVALVREHFGRITQILLEKLERTAYLELCSSLGMVTKGKADLD